MKWIYQYLYYCTSVVNIVSPGKTFQSSFIAFEAVQTPIWLSSYKNNVFGIERKVNSHISVGNDFFICRKG